MKNMFTNKRVAFFNAIKEMKIEDFYDSGDKDKPRIRFEKIKDQFHEIEDKIEKAQKAVLDEIKKKKYPEKDVKKYEKEKSYLKLKAIASLCRQVQESANGFDAKCLNCALEVVNKLEKLSEGKGLGTIGDTLDYSSTKKFLKTFCKSLRKNVLDAALYGQQIESRIEKFATRLKNFENAYKSEISKMPWSQEVISAFLHDVFRLKQGRFISYPFEDSRFLAKNADYDKAEDEWVLACAYLKKYKRDINKSGNDRNFKEGMKSFTEAIAIGTIGYPYKHRFIVSAFSAKIKAFLNKMK